MDDLLCNHLSFLFLLKILEKWLNFLPIDKCVAYQRLIAAINLLIYNLYNNILILFVCFCVWPAVDSAPRGHTDLRPVSLESIWPEGLQDGQIFFEKLPVAELLKKKFTLPMLFYGKNIELFFFIFEKCVFTNIIRDDFFSKKLNIFSSSLLYFCRSLNELTV